MLGEGPQDTLSLLKALTAAVVIFPDSLEKEEKVALLVLAAAGTFEARGAEQHDNSQPCVVLTSFPSLTATCWAAQSQGACCPSNPHHPVQQQPGSIAEGTSLCVASRLAGLHRQSHPEPSSRESKPFRLSLGNRGGQAPCCGLNSIPSTRLISATGWVPGAGLHPLLLTPSPQSQPPLRGAGGFNGTLFPAQKHPLKLNHHSPSDGV